ncbi:MAG: endonuclease/exonuclease/phosphatase family protein [Leptospiraceae bacterium]|nr:endonuclease/exonuclease/phosphatase family protein [Leptospiraceae bacterium]MCP5495026.1 endonuclease/exonuclease/phosphatase family protein [Leptospiraceae bacterium]
MLVLLFFLLLTWAHFTTLQPPEFQEEQVVCPDNTPEIEKDAKIKVISWNLQYLAGKTYVFYYDLPDGSGPDERPSTEEIKKTAAEVARVIQDEKPDIILFQEIDDGAKKTDYEDQLAKLLKLLPKDFKCHTSTFYWKADFIPHPHIMGSVGMKLSTISKYKIKSASRHALPTIPDDILKKQFNFKRAILEARLPVKEQKDFVVLNTHLDAFAQGSNTMEMQVKKIHGLLTKLTQEKVLWVIGGDFNLLPADFDIHNIHPSQQSYYNPKSEISILFDSFSSAATKEDLNGPNKEKFFTTVPNNPSISRLDKTIDYLFYSDTLRLANYRVRQEDTQKISDHLPLVGEFEIK